MGRLGALAQTSQSISPVKGTLRTFEPLRRLTAPVASEPFLNATSSNYLEEMYYAWLDNPKNVHKVAYMKKKNPSGSFTLLPLFVS